MDRKVAERLIASAIALDEPLGEIDRVISDIADEAERKALAKSLGNIFRELNDAFIQPVSREYPDLAERD